MAAEHVERKLAAILAADVAGYSRLIGLDDEGTISRPKSHRKELIDPKIAEHGGRVVKTTGDGILIEFPSVVAALRCAVEVQRAMEERNAKEPADRRIIFRVGVHVGDVIIEDGDILGDGVNVAARLEGIAEPGSICISQRVHEDVAGKVDVVFEGLGELELSDLGEAGIASDYEQLAEAGQHRDDFLDHAISEILSFGITAHVLERQHRDRRFVRQR